MTQLEFNAGTKQGPCDSCSTLMEALNILAMSLHTALQGKCMRNIIVHELSCYFPAARYIRVPLPGSFCSC
jgi:hypothetical protein